MAARPHPEDIENIIRLKFGNRFNYTPKFHSTEDIEANNYGITSPLDNWRLALKSADG